MTLKAAISLDGSIASRTGESRWITGEASRTRAHELRARHDGVLVGVGTLLSDDPSLDVRHGVPIDGVGPRPIVLDPTLRCALHPNLRALRPGALVVCAPEAPAAAQDLLVQRGVECVSLALPPRSQGEPANAPTRWRAPAIVATLAARGCGRVLVEGGALVLATFVADRCFDALHLFVAPTLLGGARLLGEAFSPSLAHAPGLELLDVERLGPDLHLVLGPRPRRPTPGP